MADKVSRRLHNASVQSYASSSSNASDSSDASDGPNGPDGPGNLPQNHLPHELASRLNITYNGSTHGSSFGATEFAVASDRASDDSETASTSSAATYGTDDMAIPCTTMEHCVSAHAQQRLNHQAPDYSATSIQSSQNSEDQAECPQSHRSTSSTSSSAVISSLKKRWKGVKKAGARGTSSAGKSLSSISASFATNRDTESWEDRHSRMGDEWLNSIVPHWRKKRKTARVRTLVFRGIPANVRGKVWCCAIGNPMNISPELFSILKDRAAKGRAEYLRGRDSLAMADGDLGGHGGHAESMLRSERSAHKAISLDLPRTFPELSFFHAEGSHYEHALRDILEAFLYLKPDVGYSQGMSFLAAVLLLYMDPYDAFSCFANMLLRRKSCFIDFFRIKMPEVKCYLLVHDRLLLEDMPALHAHFKLHSIDADLYMINWVMSLFCRALPLDLVTRIWDLYVLDGDVAIFRAALGILRLFMPRLLKMKFEDMAYFLSHIPSNEIDPNELVQSIRSVRVVSRHRFHDLFDAYFAENSRDRKDMT